MEMPEGWNRLRIYDKEVHRPIKLEDLWETLDLMKEMAEVLEDISEDRLGDDIYTQAAVLAKDVLKKFKEWK